MQTSHNVCIQVQWMVVSTAYYATTQVWPHVQHAAVFMWPDSQGDVVAET